MDSNYPKSNIDCLKVIKFVMLIVIHHIINFVIVDLNSCLFLNVFDKKKKQYFTYNNIILSNINNNSLHNY